VTSLKPLEANSMLKRPLPQPRSKMAPSYKTEVASNISILLLKI
jgi:hypothetical protein